MATIVVAGLLALTAAGVVAEVRRQYLRGLDRSLQQRSEQVAASHAAAPDAPLVDSNAEDRFAQVVDASGTVIASTPNLIGAAPVASLPAPSPDVVELSDLPIEDDTYRVVTLAIPGGGYVIVGENVDDVHDDIRVLMVTLATAFPLAVVVLAATMWWLVGRTLRRVETLRAEVAAIRPNELDRRVDVPRSRDEIARLASTLNDMLARLADATGQQRAFVADASHELRTPLTRIRASLEVDLAAAAAESTTADVCRRALADVIAMQHLVDDLLFLARHDASETAERGALVSPVDLDAVVDSEVRRARSAGSVRCRIDLLGLSPVVVNGSSSELGRALSNLLSNATRHAVRLVTVSLDERPGCAVVVIDDDGPGIPPADRERVFGRFVRLDPSRTPTDAGAGLGLAIARDIVAAHRGTVTLDHSPAGGTRAIVSLPALDGSSALGSPVNL